MSDETAIVPQEVVQLGVLQVSPEAVVERATKVAEALANVIKKKKLSVKIRDREYVRVEGWSTLGAMIGVLPRTVSVTEIQEGIFEATVELIRTTDQAIIGQGIAECGSIDELDRYGKPIWSERPRYARKSMAITRATGKAFRLSLAWIMELAGYSGTPAEEMDFIGGEYSEAKPRMENQWEQEIIDKIMELQLVQARPHAVNILNLSPFMSIPYHQLEMVEAVAYIIGWERMKDNFPEMSTEERAETMNKTWKEGNNDDCIAKAIEMLGGQND